jgi:signal recognition particle GTPase
VRDLAVGGGEEALAVDVAEGVQVAGEPFGGRGVVLEQAVGQEVMDSLTPGQQVIKIVRDELTDVLGGGESALGRSSQPPTVYMLVGLQGGGKTTTCAKLARMEKKAGRNPLLVATDVRRPAAIDQLRIVGEQVGAPVFDLGAREDPVNIARAAIAHARRAGLDPVILDTQGRLHVDAALMGELKRMQEQVAPQETLLVLDAMTGQDAVRVAQDFDAAQWEVTFFFELLTLKVKFSLCKGTLCTANLRERSNFGAEASRRLSKAGTNITKGARV